MTGSARQYGPAVALLACGAFAARTLTLTHQSLWLDEVDAVAFAQQDLPTLLRMMVSPAQNGGLFYLLLKGWLPLVGLSEFTLRYAAVLPSVLVIPLLYALGRRLFSPEAGFWAALLAATSPYLFFYAQEGKMYALYACLAVWDMYLFMAALHQGGRWRWLGYGAVTALGLYVHLFFVFLVVAQHTIALAVAWRSWGRLRGWYLTQGTLALPLLPLALWGVPAALWGYPTAFTPLPLGTILQVLLLRFTLHTESWPSPVVLVPFAAAGVAALLVPGPVPDVGIGLRPTPPSPTGRERTGAWAAGARPGRVVVLLWLVVPVLSYYLVSFQVPAFMHRYFTMLVPAYYLALGVGLAALRGRWPLLGLLSAAAILGVWGAAVLRPVEVRPDFRGAAHFVTARAQEGDAVLFVAEYGVRAFAFYAPDHPPALTAPYTNDGVPAEVAVAALQERSAPYRRVWLVLFEDWLWDGRRITRNWLERRGTQVEAAGFPGITVLAYRLDR
ncbi:MAG: glycosyltransferase family 39 protein [Chloroflexi bacterium]|nr:glycosyltransferase family 39 protein [Chloroflexota bacterium]